MTESSEVLDPLGEPKQSTGGSRAFKLQEIPSAARTNPTLVKRRADAMAESPQFGPMPIVKAMLICDSAIIEQGTNKKSLIGIFDQLTAQNFPSSQRMAIYIRLADAQGFYVFRIDIVDVERDRMLGNVTTDQVEIRDPLMPFDFILPITRDMRPSC
ncbi:MAG: DUF6941 family protein [Candidatus Entotheonellia bacterium]